MPKWGGALALERYVVVDSYGVWAVCFAICLAGSAWGRAVPGCVRTPARKAQAMTVVTGSDWASFTDLDFGGGAMAPLQVAVIVGSARDHAALRSLLADAGFSEAAVKRLPNINCAAVWLAAHLPEIIIVQDSALRGGERAALQDLLTTSAPLAPVIVLTRARPASAARPPPPLIQENAAWDSLDWSSLDAESLRRAIRYARLGFRAEQVLRESARRLAAAARLAEDAHSAKSAVMAELHHTFRTPLNAILGFSDILRDAGLSPELSQRARAYADDIFECGETLLNLLETVMDGEKLAATRRTPDDEHFLLGPEIEAARRRVGQTLTLRRITVAAAPDLATVWLRA